MPQIMRRSLLVQVVSVYLLFVTLVLATGIAVNAAIEQHLRDEVQAADQALAQEIAVDTSLKLQDAKKALQTLGVLAGRAYSTQTLTATFQAFMAARVDVEHVYWLDPLGRIAVSVKSPTSAPESLGVGAEFSPPDVVQRALNPAAVGPVLEIGIAQETAGQPGVIIADPVRDSTSGNLVGIVVESLSLAELSTPLVTVVQAQPHQDGSLRISIVDDQGTAVASSQSDQLLRNMLNQLPSASQTLHDHFSHSQLGTDPDGTGWLYSSFPVGLQQSTWAVIVGRPTSLALDVVAQLHVWLLIAALIFALGVVVFWLVLMRQVIRPLHALAWQHRSLPAPRQSVPSFALTLRRREDEVGGLARSLERLERDVQVQLAELQTLLQTSNAVVNSLDPREVGRTIIREARRLVAAQAAAVLVPDEDGVLRALVSDGHDAGYVAAVQVPQDELALPAARALRDGQPVQMIADEGTSFPPVSYGEGFRAVLAIPIISRHAGGVVLLVHRAEPQPFSQNEIDLLLTFANYATLAWEHAVLYERSDERLREVAAENERLYLLTSAEKQRLAAIMASMSDGLVLAGADGRVLYANPGAAELSGLSLDTLANGSIETVHEALRVATGNPASYDEARARAERGEQVKWISEIGSESSRRALALRLFDVHDVTDEGSSAIGRGLLLRDVTAEHAADEFKTTLLAAVGHELRTPLTAIKGHASTLLQEDVAWSPEEQRHSLQTISSEVDRLTGLVRDLLDLSRQQAGMLPLHREPVSLDVLLAGAAQRLGHPMLGLQTDLPPDLPLLHVDRARIEVALGNLLANAVAYGGEHIQVTAGRAAGEAAGGQGERVEVAVSDDGPGIEAEELPHLFERFYRARRGLHRAQGTGLGLAICKAFVEAHGGTIAAESGPSGTTIRITLPVATPIPSGALDQPILVHTIAD